MNLVQIGQKITTKKGKEIHVLEMIGSGSYGDIYKVSYEN